MDQVLVIQSCPIPCDPMDCSMPGLTVSHHLPKSAQVHDHWVGDVIQPSHPLMPSDALFSFCPESFPASGTFSVSWLVISNDQNTGTSASASVLPMSMQDQFPLGWISLQSRDPWESSAPQFRSINYLALSFLYGPALTSLHDYWKNHSFE